MIGPSQRLLLDNTQHSQQTDIQAPSGIRARNPSKRVAQTHALDRVATGIGVPLAVQIQIWTNLLILTKTNYLKVGCRSRSVPEPVRASCTHSGIWKARHHKSALWPSCARPDATLPLWEMDWCKVGNWPLNMRAGSLNWHFTPYDMWGSQYSGDVDCGRLGHYPVPSEEQPTVSIIRSLEDEGCGLLNTEKTT